MKISIVIPTYNADAFINKSYSSIINQDLSDFEIIYINNNSNDNSVAKIKALQKSDSRVRLFHQPKQGAAAARNLGINKAQGEYIYVFDVDDEIYPNALNSMIEVLNINEEVEAVFGKMVKSNKSIEETIKPLDETGNLIIQPKYYWGLKWFSQLKEVVGPPAFLYRSSLFDRIGGYNEELVICEDTAFDIKLGMSCKIAFLDQYVYLYYKHSNSIFETSKQNHNQIFILWSRLVKSHLQLYFTNEYPFEFTEILFRQLYSTMGKVIAHTPNFSDRKSIYKQINTDIMPLKLNLSTKFFLRLLVIFPFKGLLKLYVYYFAPRVSNRYLNHLKLLP